MVASERVIKELSLKVISESLTKIEKKSFISWRKNS